MPYTLKQAAEATGRSKSTIFRAIKNHTISGTKDHNGDWQIDPSELHRIFPPVSGDAPNDAPNDAAMMRSETPNEMMVLQREVEVIGEKLAAERAERGRERSTLQETIADLREDRDRWRSQAELSTRLLTDQRTQAEKDAAAPPVPVAPLSRTGWWLVVAGVVALAAAVAWWVQTHPLPFAA
ncbi:MAG: hypothetical protein ACOYL3_26435 [Desulfuromonadaceae bacterium]